MDEVKLEAVKPNENLTLSTPPVDPNNLSDEVKPVGLEKPPADERDQKIADLENANKGLKSDLFDSREKNRNLKSTPVATPAVDTYLGDQIFSDDKSFDEQYTERRKAEIASEQSENLPRARDIVLAKYPDLNEDANWNKFKEVVDRIDLGVSVEKQSENLTIIARGLGFQEKAKEVIYNPGIGSSASAPKADVEDVDTLAAKLKSKASEKILKLAATHSKGVEGYFKALANEELRREERKNKNTQDYI